MAVAFHFTFEKDWRQAPLAFWVHVPVAGTPGEYVPPGPPPVPRRGYAVLRIQFGGYELLFSSPAQLAHCIDVLSRKPLPTSRRLSACRGSSVGPNGHWLSRLPATLKSPRQREKLVDALRAVQKHVQVPQAASFCWSN